MHDPQNGVAIPHGVGNDAHGQEVINLLKGQLLLLHFLIDTVDILGASKHAAGNIGRLQFAGNDLLYPIDIARLCFLLAGDHAVDFLVGFRMGITER